MNILKMNIFNFKILNLLEFKDNNKKSLLKNLYLFKKQYNFII